MQRVRQEHFKDRCLYYTSSLIREQAPQGGARWDYQLQPVYMIGLMDFIFDETHVSQYLHKVHLMKTDTLEIFYDKLGFIFIEIPKFNKQEGDLLSELDNWLFLLKNMSKLDKIPSILKKPIFSKLFNIAEVSNLTRQEKMAYESSLKEKWDYNNSLDYILKEGLERGIREGRLEGILQGKREGLLEGKIEGKLEGKVEGKIEGKLEVAASMKKRGMEISLIRDLTGLSEDEIEKL